VTLLVAVYAAAVVVALLVRGTHVSQLARDLEVSRPVLHVHLAKLQEAGLVTSTGPSPVTGSPSAISSCSHSIYG
jgi:DNA-binding transcriptional ArsR family regulator